MPPSFQRHLRTDRRVAVEPHVQDVDRVAAVIVGAVTHGGDVARSANDLLGEEKTGGQMPIVPGCAHDDDERPAAKTDLERLLRRGHVAGESPGLQIHANDVDGMNG